MGGIKLKKKIIAIILMLVLATSVPVVQSNLNEDLEEQSSQASFDIVIPDNKIKVFPSAPWQIGEIIDLTFSVENLGSTDYHDLILNVDLALIGAQGVMGKHFFGQSVVDDEPFSLRANQIRTFHFKHEVHSYGYLFSKTCIIINVSYEGEWIENWINNFVVNKLDPEEPFRGVIPFINPIDVISTITFEMEKMEGFPVEWDVELDYSEIEDVESGISEVENQITVFHNGYLEQGMMGEVFIELHARPQGENVSYFIGDLLFRAIADDIEPTLEVNHPTNSIYFMGSKLLPYLHPLIIGNGFEGEFQITDDTYDFARVLLNNNLIHYETISDHPHWELPPGPMFGFNRLTVETYDKALQKSSRDFNVLILKLS